MSKTRDIKKQKLNYYSGLDKIRNRMHGKTKALFKEIEIYVYPRRKFNRYDSYLELSLKDFSYS
jgi:hypothetical protein